VASPLIQRRKSPQDLDGRDPARHAIIRHVRLQMLCDSPEAFVIGGSGSVAV
jgi:hypothetical protein